MQEFVVDGEVLVVDDEVLQPTCETTNATPRSEAPTTHRERMSFI